MTEPLAAAARRALMAGIRAVNPRELTARALHGWSAGLAPQSVEVIAVGKAAAGMLQGARDALGSALRGGVVISPEAVVPVPAGVAAFAGGHPMPNAEGALGAQAAARLLGALGPESRALVLVSGGASALTTLPPRGVALDDILATSRALMAAGADIRELNCVRKHLDQLKGGLMARISGGSQIRALVLSDVIGDPLDVIASGPLVADPTTYDDAIDVLRRRAVWAALPPSVVGHLLAGARGERPETPKPGDPCFANVAIEVIGNNAMAVSGAGAAAAQLGFAVEIVPTPVQGEARDAGARFAALALERRAVGPRDRPRCIVAGGETTVTVTGMGIGGRNLEFAVAAALTLDGTAGITVGSIGTDGRDGPTDAAGAVVDGSTAARARQLGVNLAQHLRDNDSLAALDAVGDVVRTGPTGTNVMDVQLAMIAPEAGAAPPRS